MFIKISTVLFVALLFTGCTSSQKMYEQNFQTAQVSSVKISDLNSTVVDFSETYSFNLGSDTCKRCVEIDGYKAFALKLEPKDNTQAYAVKIKTKVNDGVFAPKVLLLNQHSQVIKSYLAQDFTFDRGMFKKTIFINNPKDVSSILITHDQSEMDNDRKITSVKSTMIYTGYFYYQHASGDEKIKLKNTLGGNIEVKLTKQNKS